MDSDDFDALTRFDSRAIKPNDLFLILGDDPILADSIIATICQRLQSNITFISVFTSLDIDALSYESYVPQSYIYRNAECEDLLRFLRQQKQMIQTCVNTGNITHEQRDLVRQTCHTMLILDRCPYKWLGIEEVKKAVELASHLQLTIIIRTSESVSRIPAIINTKADFCFILSASAGGEHNRLYNAVGGLAPQSKAFRKLLQTNIQAHEWCMVVDRRKRSFGLLEKEGHVNEDNISHTITWMQSFARYTLCSKPKKGFRIGCDVLWQEEEAEQKEDTSALHTTQKPQVFVGNIPTLLDILQNYGCCAEDERIQITIEIVKRQDDEKDIINKNNNNNNIQQDQISHSKETITNWIKHVEDS